LTDTGGRLAAPELLPRRPRGRRGLSFLAGVTNWLVTLAITLLGLMVVTFALAELSPADPALHLAGDKATEATYQAARQTLGLDDPLPQRFAAYVGNVLTGNLGTSWSTNQPVFGDIVRVFPATLELATVAILFGALIGVALGVLAALRPRGLIDGIVRIISLIGYSVPIFWLGLLFLLLFYARLHWAAGPGRLSDIYAYTITPVTGFYLIDTALWGEEGSFLDTLSHLVLPASVLAIHSLASISRLTRASLLGELGKEYAVAARAKGVGEVRLMLTHLLPNVAGTVLTVIALAYATLLEGAVLTETVFGWPGLGRYMTTAIFASDMPAVLGGTLVIGVCFVIVNAITDILARIVDPRLS